MHDDLETRLRTAIEAHPERASIGAGRLTDVLVRVDRRRARRRRTATIVASAAIVVVGIAGIALVRVDRDPDPLASPADEPASTTSTTVTNADPAWRCTGELPPVPSDPGAAFFSDCQSVALSGDGSIEVTTVPATTTSTTTTTIVPAAATSWRRSPVEQVHVVAVGDTLYGIASRYGFEFDLICRYNEWEDCVDHLLLPDEEVRIPPNGLVRSNEEQRYVIQPGDVPASVAERFGITSEELIAANPDADLTTGFPVGREIEIPPGALIPNDGVGLGE